MSESNRTEPMHDESFPYEIRLAGHLDDRWTTWFDGLALTRHPDGTTTLCGPIPDQAALHGVIQKVRDSGLALVSVMRVEPGHPDRAR